LQDVLSEAATEFAASGLSVERRPIPISGVMPTGFGGGGGWSAVRFVRGDAAKPIDVIHVVLSLAAEETEDRVEVGMTDNIIDLQARRAAKATAPALARPALSPVVLDELLRIITAARETGVLDSEASLRFASYAVPLLGAGWELWYNG
jgi:hypothetical protein